MAVKNWLIRTTQNQLLGPVSKEKIIELIKSGKLEEDDEVASGNGYWFYIKEEDLVEKYLIGDVPQGFNPVYEVEPILTRKLKKDKTSTIGGAKALGKGGNTNDDIVLPSNDDLEYPDIEINLDDDYPDDDITVVGQISVDVPSAKSKPDHQQVDVSQPAKSNVNIMSRAPDRLDEERSRPGVLPNQEDLEYPDLGINQDSIDQKFKEVGGHRQASRNAPGNAFTEDFSDDSNDMTSDMTMVGIAPSAGSVEIFDEVDPIEEQLGSSAKPNGLKSKAKNKAAKKQVTKKAVPAAKVTKKRRASDSPTKKKVRSREFAESEDVTRDDIIEEALSKSGKKRGGRGRRRGIDTYLILFFGSLLIILAAVIVYYKKVIKKPIPFINSISIIESVHAQTEPSHKKKTLQPR